MSFRNFLVAVVSVFLFAIPAKAVEVSGGASVDVLSDYVWRGITLTDGHGATQPSVSASYEGFGVNYWASYDHDTSENNETDLTASYSHSLDIVGLEVGLEAGYIYYDLDATGGDTHEVYGSIGVDVIGAPALTYYHDVDLGDGGFLVASIGHSQELPIPGLSGIAVNVGASASMNFENDVMQFDSDGDGAVDDFNGFYNGEVTASITIPVPMLEGVYIEPKVAFSYPMSSDAERAIEGWSVDPHGGGEVVYGGVGAGFSF